MDEAKLTLGQMTKVMRTLGPLAAANRDQDLSGRSKNITRFGQGPRPEPTGQEIASSKKVSQFLDANKLDLNFGYGFDDDIEESLS